MASLARFPYSIPLSLFCALAVAGCGDDDGEGGGADAVEGGGEVVPPWDDYCVATFTEDYAVHDSFDDLLFTAPAGSQYLMAAYGNIFGESGAELLYLTANGPYEFKVLSENAPEGLPFTSNCTFDEGVPKYAAFTDVGVYETDALATKLCDLSAGSVVDRTGVSGYGREDTDLSGPATYEVQLSGFSDQCGGADRGYISVPQVEVFDTTTWIVPVQSVLAPE